MLPLKKAVIEVCGACNYKCQMCPHSFDGGRERPFRQMMNYQMYLNVLDQLIDSEVEEIFLVLFPTIMATFWVLCSILD